VSALLDFRWSPFDLWQTLLDLSVQQGGVLKVQDDLGGAAEVGLPAALLPYEKLDALINLTDLRQVERSAKHKRGRAHGTRQLAQVTTLWIHQTAALLGSPDRFMSVPAHCGVDLQAGGILMHPLRAYMYHAQKANRFTVGMEVACRAAGIEGDPLTFWRSRKEKKSGRFYSELVREATDDQLVTAQHLVAYYIEEVDRQARPLRDQGIDVPGIVAIGTHRNSHKSRTGDPGSRIYEHVVQWAIREYGLQPGPIVGSGVASPTAWTGEGAVRYSGRVRGY